MIFAIILALKQPDPTITNPPNLCSADIASEEGNCPDGVIDMYDLWAVLETFNQLCPENCSPTFRCINDINRNCIHDFNDITLILNNWGECQSNTVSKTETPSEILSQLSPDWAWIMLQRYESWTLWRSRAGFTCQILERGKRVIGRGRTPTDAIYHAAVQLQ